jgi:hypothetical protein
VLGLGAASVRGRRLLERLDDLGVDIANDEIGCHVCLPELIAMIAFKLAPTANLWQWRGGEPHVEQQGRVALRNLRP